MPNPVRFRFVLVDLVSPINIGKIFRICENFNIDLAIYDPRGILQEQQARRTIEDFSCGATDRLSVLTITNIEDFLQQQTWLQAQKVAGRVIATSLAKQAKPLRNFGFLPGDQVLLGNEVLGLARPIVEQAQDSITIELPRCEVPKPVSFKPAFAGLTEVNNPGVPCLNVAISAGILAYHQYLSVFS